MRVVQKKGRKRIVPNCKIVADAVCGGFRNENGAVFLAFPADDKLATVEINGVAIKSDELGDAKPTREEELDDCAITKPGFGVGRNNV